MTGKGQDKLKISRTYRVKQPIDNFKFRVKIVQRKSPLAELFENEDETRDTNYLVEEECTFGWQEKVLSIFEADFYGDERNCRNDLSKDYHQTITEQELTGSRLYTYIARDNYLPELSAIASSFKSKLSLNNVEAVIGVKNRKPFGERYNRAVVDDCPSDTRVRMNHYLYRERESMHVLADLTSKDETSRNARDAEALLVTVTYDKALKSLTVEPDFTDQEFYTVEANGMLYDYWVVHASREQTLRDAQKEKELVEQEFQQLKLYKDAELFHDLQLPPPSALRVFVNLEIVAARNFTYDSLFVTYVVDLPENWTASDAKCLRGRTQRCTMKRGTANFSYIAEFVVDIDLDKSADDDNVQFAWPRLLLSARSLDAWTRYRVEGYATVPLPRTTGPHEVTVTTWRPAGNIVDGLRRFFTGGGCELEDITYCGIPTEHDGHHKLEKTNLVVEPSGDITLRFNIVHQSRMFTKGIDVQRETFERLGANSLLNSVDSILDQFKAARERMIQARTMN